MPSYRGTTHRPSEGAQSATIRAYLHLKDEILTCRISPGSTVHEGNLAQSLEMSKTPVREALGMLSHEGFIQVRPRHGYRVTDVTLADVQEIFHLRLHLEPAAAFLAARNATAEQLEHLRILAVTDQTSDHASSVIQATAFHSLLAEASGSGRLAATLENLLEEGQRLFFLGLDLSDDVHHQGSDHEALVEALQAGNATRAEEIARQQVETSRSHMLSAIMASLSGPGPGVAAGLVKLHGDGQP